MYHDEDDRFHEGQHVTWRDKLTGTKIGQFLGMKEDGNYIARRMGYPKNVSRHGSKLACVSDGGLIRLINIESLRRVY